MKGFFETADRIPVTLLVALAYLTLAALSGMRLSFGMVDGNPEFQKQLLVLGSLELNRLFDGEYWRLLTHAFLHFGLLHLALNTYALLIFGPPLEAALGSVKFALLYVVSAVAGGVVALLWNSHLVNLAGGSGALFGLLGCYGSMQARAGRGPFDFLRTLPGRQWLGLIAVNLFIGVLFPVIANSAHVGGLVAGFVLGVMFLDTGRAKPDRLFRITQVGWAALFVLLVAYACAPVANRFYGVQRWQRMLATSQPTNADGDPEARRQLARALLHDPEDLARVLARYPSGAAMFRRIQMDAR